MRKPSKKDRLYERLEFIQSMILSPEVFDEKMKRDLNLSEEFVDQTFSAYALLEDLLAKLASSFIAYEDVVALWDEISSGQSDNDRAEEYRTLLRSEFGRVVLYRIEAAMRQK